MKKITLVFAIVFLAVVVVFAIRFFSGPEDFWFCENGVWQKHGNPLISRPLSGCGQAKAEKIRIFEPESGQTVSFPLKVMGEARGNWYFEAGFPIKLLDANNKELAATIAQAQSDWMTEDFVAFEAVIDIDKKPQAEIGTLVFQKDNPSGLTEYEQELSLPVYFPEQKDLLAIKAFFNHRDLDQEFSCQQVAPTERYVSKTLAIARIALESLLRGPSYEEQAKGFFTSINSGVEIQKLTIEDNLASVDFNSQLEYQVGGSCRTVAIRSQIAETLKQFPNVKTVVISIDGRSEDILQP